MRRLVLVLFTLLVFAGCGGNRTSDAGSSSPGEGAQGPSLGAGPVEFPGSLVSTIPADEIPEPSGKSLDPTIATTVYQAAGFLITAQGAVTGSIDPNRVAILSGRVLAAGAGPTGSAISLLQPALGPGLRGAKVSILGHPEWGSTTVGQDGRYALVVNGGGYLTVVAEAAARPTVMRTLAVDWQAWQKVADIVMTPYDPHLTRIDFSSPVQVARGSVVTDADGSRQATLLFFQGTTATMQLPDGTRQGLGSLGVRATEFTVGANGPAAMPGDLPPNSGYTYAAEFSVDEAVEAGATTVEFSQPVVAYLENFLHFPVGQSAPVGSFSRVNGVWQPSPNGRVVKIVSVSAGLADLDLTGDSVADDPALFAIGADERRTLAGLYSVGQELWRVPMDHFTPWDYNWPYAPPSDATAPTPSNPPSKPPKPKDPDDPCKQTKKSELEISTQILGEDADLTGSFLGLHYQSDRVPGRTYNRSVDFAVSGSSVPGSLKRIEAELTIAGQEYFFTFPAAPNQKLHFVWDGLDEFQRPLYGVQTARIRVSYIYDLVYVTPAGFAQGFGNLSQANLGTLKGRQEFSTYQDYQFLIGSWDAASQKLGSWTPSVLQFYDVQGKILQNGTGGRRSAQSVANVVTTIAGTGASGFSGDGGPALQANLGGLTDQPGLLSVGPDGSLYLGDASNARIRRITPLGTIVTVAGTGVIGHDGQGGPATSAALGHLESVLALSDGSLVFSDEFGLRRIGPDGIIAQLAGGGSDLGEGARALQADLGLVRLAGQGPDGSLYFYSQHRARIRKLAPDGRVYTVVGTGSAGYSGDGGSALSAQIAADGDAAISAGGSLYLTMTRTSARWAPTASSTPSPAEAIRPVGEGWEHCLPSWPWPPSWRPIHPPTKGFPLWGPTSPTPPTCGWRPTAAFTSWSTAPTGSASSDRTVCCARFWGPRSTPAPRTRTATPAPPPTWPEAWESSFLPTEASSSAKAARPWCASCWPPCEASTSSSSRFPPPMAASSTYSMPTVATSRPWTP